MPPPVYPDSHQGDKPNVQAETLQLTTQIVSAFVSHNPLPIDQLQTLIREVYNSLAEPAGPAPVIEVPQEPAVNPRKSVFSDHLICLDCGKQATMLKRHIMTAHGLTIEAYKTKWGLPHDYPMVAPDYAKTRSDLAKDMGLGRARGAKKAKRAK